MNRTVRTTPAIVRLMLTASTVALGAVSAGAVHAETAPGPEAAPAAQANASQVASSGEVRGVVTSSSLQRPVRGARVSLKGSPYQTTTNDEGRYTFTGVPAGAYVLRVQQPGYEPFHADITVSQNDVVMADAVLALERNEGQDIVVTGTRASRLLAIERKRALPTIADVVSSDGIGKLPDYNTAEALRRLPGVSVEIDQGEPRYVVVRGIDPNLNQVTVDGNLVGIPEAEGRRVALDTIPSSLVAAIEVVKAVTPDYDANAIGGSINIVTPTAFDRADDFTFVSGRGSYNEKSGKLGFGASASHGRKFGSYDQFGIVVGASYSKRFIASDLADPLNWSPVSPEVSSPTEYRLFDYRIMRERIGGIVNLDWRPSDDVRFYVRNIYNEFTDHEERDQFDFTLGDPSAVSPTSVSFDNGRATREFRQNNQTQKLYNISPGAEFTFGNVELDLNYTYAHAQEHTPVRDDLEFRSATGKSATLDLTDSRPLFTDLDPSLLDPAAFPLRRIRRRREKIDEDLNAVRADVKVNFGGASESFLKFGAKYTGRVKKRDNYQAVDLAAVPTTFADTGAVLPTPDNFYNGDYNFGPAMDYNGVLDYYDANPGYLERDDLTTAVNDKGSDYSIDEKIYAGYGMASLTFGDLTAIGGVRVERTEGEYRAFAIRDTDGDGVLEISDLTPLKFDHNYTHVLPSVHLNYRPSTEFTLRGAWTNTIGRPNYDDSVPTFEEEDGEGEAGNPDLKPYTSMGLDLSAEYYPDAESIFSIGAFYKKLENPVFTRSIMNTSFNGVPLVTLSQPQNADSGELFGLEMNAQRRFDFLPAPLDGLGASLNATYVDSSVVVPGREDEEIPFFAQSNWIVNGALFYEKGPIEARVALSFRDDLLLEVGSSAASDIYQKGRTVLDARIGYKVFEGVQIFGSISNFNEAPLTSYQATPDQIYERELYSYSLDFGFSAQF